MSLCADEQHEWLNVRFVMVQIVGGDGKSMKMRSTRLMNGKQTRFKISHHQDLHTQNNSEELMELIMFTLVNCIRNSETSDHQ